MNMCPKSNKELFLENLADMVNFCIQMRQVDCATIQETEGKEYVETSKEYAELTSLENLLADICDTLAVYHPDRVDYFWRIAPYRDLIEKVMAEYSHYMLNYC